MNFAQKKCRPCEGNVKPYNLEQARENITELQGWQISDDARSINRLFIMKDFMAAIKFIKDIAAVVEAENHHPDIHLTGYRQLRVELSTHAIGGLSENDFILAAKINELPVDLKVKSNV